MHEEIKRFSRAGRCEDKVRAKEQNIRDLENEMRDFGYAPSIDLDPQFTVTYDRRSENYEFVLSVYGVEVGSDSWQVSGVANGKKTMKHTAPNK